LRYVRLEVDVPLLDFYWVGASDIGQKSGQFQWLDGSKVTVWKKGDPNDYRHGKETCVLFSDTSAELVDYQCSRYSYSICEAPREYVGCIWNEKSTISAQNYTRRFLYVHSCLIKILILICFTLSIFKDSNEYLKKFLLYYICFFLFDLSLFMCLFALSLSFAVPSLFWIIIMKCFLT
jgi:hypothetical protein